MKVMMLRSSFPDHRGLVIRPWIIKYLKKREGWLIPENTIEPADGATIRLQERSRQTHGTTPNWMTTQLTDIWGRWGGSSGGCLQNLQNFWTYLRIPELKYSTKIHNPGNPGRPIISGVGTLDENISGWVESVFKPLVRSTTSDLRDTSDLLNTLLTIGPLSNGAILSTISIFQYATWGWTNHLPGVSSGW